MIDIIIPVYNTPQKDLKRCLNSILNQSLKEYKVYIINDGSNKKTEQFLINYTANKQKFILKTTKNNGISSARNLGIDISNSKYITFIDADDKIETNFLKEAIELIEKHNLDLIIGGYNEIKNNKIIRTRLCQPGLHIYKKNNTTPFFTKLLTSKIDNSNKEINDCPTGRIYTRVFTRKSINNLKFNPNIHISEDTLFMIDYMYTKPTIGIINKIWYNYYINNYSITNGTNKEKQIKYIEDFIQEVKKRYEKETNNTIKNAYLKRIEKSYNSIKMIID